MAPVIGFDVRGGNGKTATQEQTRAAIRMTATYLIEVVSTMRPADRHPLQVLLKLIRHAVALTVNPRYARRRVTAFAGTDFNTCAMIWHEA